MITVQETTVWDGNYPNHKYILSDDGRWAYAYIRKGDKYPQIFNKPIGMDWRGRKYTVITRTKDVDPNVHQWKVAGSKDNVYVVTEEDGEFTCTCPAATYRHQQCKHIQKIKQELGVAQE